MSKKVAQRKTIKDVKNSTINIEILRNMVTVQEAKLEETSEIHLKHKHHKDRSYQEISYIDENE